MVRTTKRKLLIVVNDPGFFLSHRAPIATTARAEGYDVHVASGDGKGVEAIRELGLTHHRIPISRSGTNPFVEVITVWILYRLFRRITPDLVHLVTIKPVVYGGVVGRLTRVPGMVSAVSGLGYVFSTGGSPLRSLLRATVLALYRFALRHPNQVVIFQNEADRDLLLEATGIPESRTSLIPGSGVDTDRFAYHEEPSGAPVVVMACRLLEDKGVREFAQAASRLQGEGMRARFVLAGDVDPANPSSFTADEVEAFTEGGALDWLGRVEDVPSLLAGASVVTLPSYYGEGLPRVLAEAAASGRAVVTTDWPGCRDAIIAGVTGLTVPPRDSQALSDALRILLLDPELRKAMGTAGRQLAESRFRIEHVVAQHLRLYAALLP